MMKFKKLPIIAAMLALTLVLSSCAGGGGAAGSGASADQVFTIQIGHVIDETAPTHRGAVLFQEYVERESNGRISVEIFPNALLGGDLELVEAVQLGTIQMAIPAITVLTNSVPEFGIGDMPFLWSNAQSAFQAFDGELGAFLDGLLEETVGARNLGYAFNSVRALSNSVRPVTSPEDMQGLTIRIMESPIYVDTFNALGANPTPMAFGEVFTALQQGVVDGQDNGAPLTYSMRFFEVQPYFTEIGHTMSFLANIINMSFYNSLPEYLREIIHSGARKYLVEEQRIMQLNEREIALSNMIAAGVTVSEVTPENHQRFIDAVQSVYENNIGVMTQEIIEMATRYN